MPPLKLLIAADCRRGSPTPNAAAARCLLYLPLEAVAAPDGSGTDADSYSGTPTS